VEVQAGQVDPRPCPNRSRPWKMYASAGLDFVVRMMGNKKEGGSTDNMQCQVLKVPSGSD